MCDKQIFNFFVIKRKYQVWIVWQKREQNQINKNWQQQLATAAVLILHNSELKQKAHFLAGNKKVLEKSYQQLFQNWPAQAGPHTQLFVL